MTLYGEPDERTGMGKVFRKGMAAVVCAFVLWMTVMPGVLAEDRALPKEETRVAGEWSLLFPVGMGILFAGGLAALITTGGKQK